MQPDLHILHEEARRMDRDDWALLWQRHADGTTPPLDLPAYPEEDVQKITNNCSGSPTMAAAAKFYNLVDEEVLARFEAPTDQLRLLDYGGRLGSHHPAVPPHLRTGEHQCRRC